jgi:hypothetical protein
MRQIKSGLSKQEFLIQNQHLVQVQSSYENLEFRRGVVKKTDIGFIAHRTLLQLIKLLHIPPCSCEWVALGAKRVRLSANRRAGRLPR